MKNKVILSKEEIQGVLQKESLEVLGHVRNGNAVVRTRDFIDALSDVPKEKFDAETLGHFIQNIHIELEGK